MKEQLKIMGIGAHPDDLEAYAGATLNKAARAGHDITLVSLTDGELGSKRHSKQKTAKIRSQEMKAAREILGASSVISLHLPDGRLDEDKFKWPAKKGLVTAIRRTQPDILITLNHDDYHPDHRAASEIAQWSAQFAEVEGFKLRDNKRPWQSISAIEQLPAVYEADPQGLKTRRSQTANLENDPHLAEADVIVIVTAEELQTKLDAFNKHRSQMNSRRDDHKEFEKALIKVAEKRGSQVGAQYGEGFTQVSYGGELFSTHDRLTDLV